MAFFLLRDAVTSLVGETGSLPKLILINLKQLCYSKASNRKVSVPIGREMTGLSLTRSEVK